MFKNWKTSLAGIIAIAGVATKIVNNDMHSITSEDLAIVAAGLIGLFAKDNNVTGGTKTQPTVQNVPTEIEKK